jgi:NUC153 domain
MLRDERFTAQAKVDRYGRRLNSQKGKKELARLYHVEKEPSPTKDAEQESDDEADDDGEVQAKLESVRNDYDPAREGGFSESSSEEPSSDEEEEELEEAEVEFLDQAAADAPAGEVSARLAAVNMDWDNVRAMDIMAVLSSFLPSGGRILKVAIYPSEFGKERMEREDAEGPPKEVFAKRISEGRDQARGNGSDDEDKDDEDEDDRIKNSILEEDEGEEFNSTQLRRYQIERLRYYYAVITCSSSQCAKEIYDAIDGAEYLSSANFFDLRFIPDDTDFTEDTPRDECEQVPDRYQPNDFVTGALQHSKVKLSWDAEDPRRKEVQQQVFSGSRTEINENDLKAYLASDSSDDDAASKDAELVESGLQYGDKQTKKAEERQRMRALLGLTDEPFAKDKELQNGPVGDMQITFTSGLSDRQGGVFSSESEIGETTIEKYARKEKERKARRKEQLKAANEPAISSNNDAAETNEDLGFDDPFFTAPEQERAAGAAARKQEKRKKRLEREVEDAQGTAQRAELELLVTDDHNAAGHMAHFDMKDLEKGEKALRKKAKLRAKMSAREQQAAEAKANDNFAMNVQDPRFQAIYERNEFAVDPSHPKFKQTEGMAALLQEHRRKRAAGERDAEADVKRKKPKAEKGVKVDKDGVQSLLTRIKTKSRR